MNKERSFIRIGLAAGIVMLFLIGLLFTSGCSAIKLTPKQTMLWGMNVYNSQYDMYIETVLDESIPPEEREKIKNDPSTMTTEMVRKDLTQEQIKILRVKKEVLNELYPIITMANDYMKSGKLPPDELQKKMVELLNRILGEV